MENKKEGHAPSVQVARIALALRAVKAGAACADWVMEGLSQLTQDEAVWLDGYLDGLRWK